MEAIALFGGIAISVGGVLVLAFKALSAERRAGEQKARADVLDANHTIAARQLADTAAQLKDAQERLDDLSTALVNMAGDMPVNGSFHRLLQVADRRKAASGDGAGSVHHDESSDAGRDDGLLKPGE